MAVTRAHVAGALAVMACCLVLALCMALLISVSPSAASMARPSFVRRGKSRRRAPQQQQRQHATKARRHEHTDADGDDPEPIAHGGKHAEFWSAESADVNDPYGDDIISTSVVARGLASTAFVDHSRNAECLAERFETHGRGSAQGDGGLGPTEREALHRYLHPPLDQLRKARAIVARVDFDKSGGLAPLELRELLRRAFTLGQLDGSFQFLAVQTLMNQFDWDCDAELRPFEIVQLFLAPGARVIAPSDAALMDLDWDGYVTAAEVCVHFNERRREAEADRRAALPEASDGQARLSPRTEHASVVAQPARMTAAEAEAADIAICDATVALLSAGPNVMTSAADEGVDAEEEGDALSRGLSYAEAQGLPDAWDSLAALDSPVCQTLRRRVALRTGDSREDGRTSSGASHTPHVAGAWSGRQSSPGARQAAACEPSSTSSRFFSDSAPLQGTEAAAEYETTAMCCIPISSVYNLLTAGSQAAAIGARERNFVSFL